MAGAIHPLGWVDSECLVFTGAQVCEWWLSTLNPARKFWNFGKWCDCQPVDAGAPFHLKDTSGAVSNGRIECPQEPEIS